MAGLTNLLYTARDALAAQSYGLSVTGNNIANANTPQYVRREAVLQTRSLAGASGGVEVQGIRRATDIVAERRLLEASGLHSSAYEHDRQLSQVEALFNDAAGTGLGSALDALMSSFSGLASNPGDATARSTVLERAQAFAGQVNAVGDALATQRSELLEQARQTVDAINARATEVAKLSRQISMAQANNSDASDLVDQRNLVLLDMSELVDLRTFYNGSGELVVQAAGTTLVEGGSARSFQVDLDGEGSMRLLASRTGGPPTEVTAYLSGGRLAGLKEARDGDVFEVQRRFDQFVFDVGSAINAQHAAGYGQDGVTGRSLFQLSATPEGAARSVVLDPELLGRPERVAAAGSAAELPGGSSNAVALSRLADAAVAGAGTKTAAQSYGDLIGYVGGRKAAAADQVGLRDAIFTQTQAFRESTSGVSLDEEMVALTRYQRAYEASAKVLSTVDQLLEELIARLGR
ncbi:MAG TPA: flagellar hook-associated protein FlgK [Polyangiaceae bacterium]|nr:flagellar hook-associated protein FlgK [Polyangiaceae bacterium]